MDGHENQENKLRILQRFINLLNWLWWDCFAPNYMQLKRGLSGNNFIPIQLPATGPSVSANTRFRLEDLFDTNSWSESGALKWGGSHRIAQYDGARSRIYELFSNLIKVEIKQEAFDLTHVRGCSASKSFGDGHYNANIKYKSVDEWGATLGTLKDLVGKSEEEQIRLCLNHSQCRLDQQVGILHDNWHGFSYWVNAGGSHHGMRLIFLLKQHGQKLLVNASIKYLAISEPVVVELVKNYAIFLYQPSYQYTRWHTNLNREMIRDVPFLEVELKQDIIDSGYQMLVIPKGDKMGDIVIEHMEKMCLAGKSVSFKKFIGHAMSLNA